MRLRFASVSGSRLIAHRVLPSNRTAYFRVFSLLALVSIYPERSQFLSYAALVSGTACWLPAVIPRLSCLQRALSLCRIRACSCWLGSCSCRRAASAAACGPSSCRRFVALLWCTRARLRSLTRDVSLRSLVPSVPSSCAFLSTTRRPILKRFTAICIPPICGGFLSRAAAVRLRSNRFLSYRSGRPAGAFLGKKFFSLGGSQSLKKPPF